MPVLVGGKPPKRRFNIKGEWIAIGLGLPALLVMFAIINAQDEDPKSRETVSQPQSIPSPVVASTPVAAPQPDGIGVSRAAVQSMFEQPDIGFSFETVTPVRGQPRVMGTSPNKLAVIELIGPPNELVSATIMVGVPSDDNGARMMNVAYTIGFIKNAAPQWTNGNEWFQENLTAILNSSSNEASTTFAGNRAELTVLREMSTFTLTIKPN